MKGIRGNTSMKATATVLPPGFRCDSSESRSRPPTRAVCKALLVAALAITISIGCVPTGTAFIKGYRFLDRIRLDWLRISRGPWRAPVRLVTPPSKGMPTSPTSTLARSSTKGARMKVGMPV